MYSRSLSVVSSIIFALFSEVVSAMPAVQEQAKFTELYNAQYRRLGHQTQPILDPYHSYAQSHLDKNSLDINAEWKSIDKCQQPAKAFLLAKVLSVDIDLHDCKKVQNFLDKTNNSSILLAYVNPSVRSPMSYFGHTFIVFNYDFSPFDRTVSFSSFIPKDINFSK